MPRCGSLTLMAGTLLACNASSGSGSRIGSSTGASTESIAGTATAATIGATAAASTTGSTTGAPSGSMGVSSTSGTGSSTTGGLPTPTFRCAGPTTAPLLSDAGAGNNRFTVDLSTGDSTDRMVDNGAAFALDFDTRLAAHDTVTWTIADSQGHAEASGSFWVDAGNSVTQLACHSTLAGYFAVTARVEGLDAGLPMLGSRPAGFASFGVLPALTPILGTPTFAHNDDHRFGIQGTIGIPGGGGFEPLYGHLGVTWVNRSMSWSTVQPLEGVTPTAADDTGPADPWGTYGLIPYNTLNGLPAWQNSNNLLSDGGVNLDGGASMDYAPISWTAYSGFVADVARQQPALLEASFPTQAHNYYQVTWEPDISWRSPVPDFLQLYQETYAAIHANDPDAVVLGPTYSNPRDVVSMRFLALSATSYLDGGFAALAPSLDAVSIHGYTGTAVPGVPPEATPLVSYLRAIRHAMVAASMPAHAKLISSEVGISIQGGYGPAFPTAPLLLQQAEDEARLHLLLLGEGADVTYYFYSADYLGESGFGLNFNLAMPFPNPGDAGVDFGSGKISPKPAAMMLAALSAILDGTITLGALSGLPASGSFVDGGSGYGAFGYAFQRIGGPVITALWAHNGGFDAGVPYALSIDAPGSAGTTVVIDAMGNPETASYANGQLRLMLGELPQYVRSTNASVIAAQVTTPEGYSPEQ